MKHITIEGIGAVELVDREGIKELFWMSTPIHICQKTDGRMYFTIVYEPNLGTVENDPFQVPDNTTD